MSKIKLQPDELKELKHRALLYHSRAGQFLTLQTSDQAEQHFKDYHHYLGEKYHYDPMTAEISEDGVVIWNEPRFRK